MTSTLDRLAPGFTAKLNLITDLLLMLAAMLAAGFSVNDVIVVGAAELERVLRNTPVSEVLIAGQALKQAPEMQAAIRVCERFGVPFALPLSGFRFDRARPIGGRAVVDGYVHYLSMDLKRHQRA